MAYELWNAAGELVAVYKNPVAAECALWRAGAGAELTATSPTMEGGTVTAVGIETQELRINR